jgi:hypothetical protein
MCVSVARLHLFQPAEATEPAGLSLPDPHQPCCLPPLTRMATNPGGHCDARFDAQFTRPRSPDANPPAFGSPTHSPASKDERKCWNQFLLPQLARHIGNRSCCAGRYGSAVWSWGSLPRIPVSQFGRAAACQPHILGDCVRSRPAGTKHRQSQGYSTLWVTSGDGWRIASKRGS